MSELCDKCARLFTGELLTGFDIDQDDAQKNRFRHHQNIDALERSGLQGCPCCRLVMSYFYPFELAVLRPDPSRSYAYNIYADMTKNGGYDETNKVQNYGATFTFTYPFGLHDEIGRYERKVFWLGAGRQTSPMTLSDSTESGESWNFVQQQLSACLEYHEKCSRDSATTLWNPTRLLDLGPSRANLPLRLVEREEIPPGSNYTTLSHCWGNTEVVKLRSDNLAQMKQSIRVHILSKTFQHAVEVTRRLGIRYLWIDSLCIIQDSDIDWKNEAIQMEDVYRNCFLNIAATHSANGEGGLFTRRDPLVNSPVQVQAIYDNEEPKYLMAINPGVSFEVLVETQALNTRGWVVQERTFSPRICHFTSDQIVWECNHSSAFEEFSTDHRFIKDGLKTLSTMTELTSATWQCWWDIVKRYSAAKLTYESDKLVAISGIVQRLRRLFNTDYLAGLWREDIECQLVWKLKTLNGGKTLASRSLQYVAPTWSWTSTNGVEVYIRSRENFPDPTYLLAHVSQVQVQPEGSTTICNEGLLRLLCSLVPVMPSFQDPNTISIITTASNKVPTETKPIAGLTQLDVPIPTNNDNIAYYCIPILDGMEHDGQNSGNPSYRLQGIIVSCTDAAKREFQRCGWFSILETNENKDNFWKCAYKYADRALEEGWDNVACYDGVYHWLPTDDGGDYGLSDGMPRFEITIV